MKSKLTLTLAFLCLVFTNQLFAYKISWGEFQKTSTFVSEIFPVGGEDFFATKYTRFGKSSANFYSGFKISSTGSMKLLVDGKTTSFSDCTKLGDKFYVLSSRTENLEITFYAQEYNRNIEPTGDPLLITSITLPNKKSYPTLKLLTSLDDDLLCVYWSTDGFRKSEEKASYGFKLFGKDLEELKTGEYDLPFESKLCDVGQVYLTNTGDLFTVITEFEMVKAGLRESKNLKEIHVYKVAEGELDELTYDLGEFTPRAIKINSDNVSKLVIAGTFGDKDNGGVLGIYTTVIDYTKNQELTTNLDKFSDEFIKKTKSTRELEKRDKKEAKGKDVGELALANFVMRDIYIQKDGNIYGALEMYYMYVTTTTDSKGNTRTTYHYVYGNIISFLLNSEGEIQWVNMIKKLQHTTNDNGVASGFYSFIDDGKYNFIFNDNSDNFDTNGKRAESELEGMRLGKKKSCSTVVSFDLESGEISNELLFTRSEVEAYVFPKKFAINPKENNIILYAVKRKTEKFGLLQLND